MQMQIGSVVTTRKNHPCGSNRWEIVRTGADYKLKCLGCGHTVWMSAETLTKAVRTCEPPQEERKDG